MKKSATKFLAVVLCLAMVLGTSISAMAVTVGNTDIKINYFDNSVNVTTSVSTEAAEEVTYMVHNADNFFSATKDNIKYIDQKNINGTDVFEYALNGYDSATDKIYVGGQALDAPVQIEDATTSDSGITVKVNGTETNATIDIEATYVNVYLPEAVNATAVTLDGAAVEFAKGNGCIYILGGNWQNGSVIDITVSTLAAAPVMIKGSSFAKLTPAEIGTVVIDNSYSTFYSNNDNLGIVHDLYPSRNEGASWFTDDTIEGTFDWKAYVSRDASANTATLVNNTTADASAFTIAETSAFYNDVKAVLDDIAADGESDAITATDETTGIYTVSGKSTISIPAGKTMLPNSYTTEIYVPVAGNYRIFAAVSNTGGAVGARYITVTANGTSVNVLDDVVVTGQAATVFDSDLIPLKAGVNEITIARTGTIRFDAIAFIPEASCDALLNYGTSSTRSYNTSLGFLYGYHYTNGCLNNHDMTLVASGIKIAQPVLTSDELLTFARVLGGGFANCGVEVTTADGTSEKFDAIGVDGNGYFAIGIEGTDGEIGTLFNGAEVSAYVDTYTSSVKTAKLAETAE